jgi:polyferredoxin
MVKRRVTGILKAIERWASESDDRMRLVIILVWASFGMLVIMSTVIAGWIMLPPGYHLF